MAYSIPDCFMIAFAAGLIFAVVYEILRIIRVMFPFQVVTFVCDIVFFVIAAGAVTKLSLSLGNYIRIYTVLGFGAGIFTYITTLGRLLNIVENAVAGAVRSALSAVFRFFGRIFGRLFGAIAHVWAGVFGEINKICLSAEKKLRKPLQNKVKIVYNKESRKVHTRGSETGHVIKGSGHTKQQRPEESTAYLKCSHLPQVSWLRCSLLFPSCQPIFPSATTSSNMKIL